MFSLLPLVSGAYIVCSVLFILCLSGLSSPASSQRGTYFGITAMSIAILSTGLKSEVSNYLFFFPALLSGGTIGSLLALRVKMANMPQMIAILHSFVGLAATLVTFSSFSLNGDENVLGVIETILGVFIGSITFSGSIIAYAKFNELISSDPFVLCGNWRHVSNVALAGICMALGLVFALENNFEVKCVELAGIAGVAGLLGWNLVIAIGAADMPVVVSMLNSLSGWAICMNGFLLENWLLLITGALVGSSGAILSYIMCKAMNRSFFSVIFGSFVQTSDSNFYSTSNKSKVINLAGTLKLLKESTSIIIVPGYGMAVSRCQHKLEELSKFLRSFGKKVEFCIHPVAGRLPGHMNVLLAEADVDYKYVKEMDEVNSQFSDTDLVLVVGANDIVNPEALEDYGSNISGMAVCKVWNGKNVIVFKRGPDGLGYSKCHNPLFVKPNTQMFYGDALDSLSQIISEAKNSRFYQMASWEKDQVPVSENANLEPVKTFLNIGVPLEIVKLEKRVAVTPNVLPQFRALGFNVKIQTGAGVNSGFTDKDYELAGGEIVSFAEVWTCEVILKVRKIEKEEEDMLGKVKYLISYVNPSLNSDWLKKIAKKYPELTCLSMDCVPRTGSAQKFDSLTSMGYLSGYRAVVEAFQVYQKCPKPMITAAGKLPSTNVLVLGAGIAGCSTISYCKNLGCTVKAMDSRPDARSDAESMGATFIEVAVEDESGPPVETYLKAQSKILAQLLKNTDIVFTCAGVSGSRPPVLINEKLLNHLKPGSVIVDIAAEIGGNCSFTVKDKIIVTENGVTVIGFTDLVSRMAPNASELYSKNLYNLIQEIGTAEKFSMNLHHEVIGAMHVIRKGKMMWYEKPPLSPSLLVVTTGKIAATWAIPEAKVQESWVKKIDFLLIALGIVGVFVGISYGTQFNTGVPFMTLMVIFVLDVFIGYMVIWNVTPVLHTPLLSATNAISGIILIGAMLLLDPSKGSQYDQGSLMGALSVMFASINVFGGFIVTYRMLHMFKTKIE